MKAAGKAKGVGAECFSGECDECDGDKSEEDDVEVEQTQAAALGPAGDEGDAGSDHGGGFDGKQAESGLEVFMGFREGPEGAEMSKQAKSIEEGAGGGQVLEGRPCQVGG